MKYPERLFVIRRNCRHKIRIASQSPPRFIAGQMVIVMQAVLLALAHRSSKPSQDRWISVVYHGFAPHHSGGSAPALNRLLC